MKSKGWIALDIDGTITESVESIPDPVCHYLKGLHESGWRLFFLTGRTFSFAFSSLQKLTFPFLLAVQNGADVMKMPSKEKVFNRYLDTNILPHLEDLYLEQKEDFLIYAGYEYGDFCYYRPKRFSPLVSSYLDKVKVLCPKPWQEVDNFNSLSSFPLIKCLGAKEEMTTLNNHLLKVPSIAATFIRDRIADDIFLNLITHVQATKGHALENVINAFPGGRGHVIAGGDDLNDISMLLQADTSIVMKTAPSEMFPLADIIAPSASENGIIQALDEAIKRSGV